MLYIKQPIRLLCASNNTVLPGHYTSRGGENTDYCKCIVGVGGESLLLPSQEV